MKFTGFIGPSYTLQSPNVECQRCVNLYPEMDELGTGKENEVAALLSTPGLALLLTLAGGVVRGIYTGSNGILYAVGGNKFYSISSSWIATELGTLSTSSGKVSMADNGTQLIVVDGSATGYGLTFAGAVFAVSGDADFLGADQVTFQDGYFIFNKPNSGQFYISGLNSLDFDALDFSTSEGNPDLLVGLISIHRDLWLFNEETTEVFFNSGAADFPFERSQGAFIEYGCDARFSIAKNSNTVFWLGRNDGGGGIVFMANGYTPQRISTHAVEYAIKGYSTISDASAYCYQDGGHSFYVLNFPSADTTWVFDASTSLWHERAYTNNGTLERHRADCLALAYGKHIVGDYDNGKVYELSPTTYSDDGAEITRLRAAPHISAELNLVFYSKFQLDLETGVGLDGITQGTDPQIMLDFSDDGGHTWSNEKWRSFGKIGNRHKRAIWRRLGASRDRVFRVTITDPVKVTLIGAQIDLERAAS